MAVEPSKPRKKLIEVALPLPAINEASAREKSIRHGHPSTLHLWWSRKPLAACRAVLFAQLVDDPSSVPEEFPTEAEQKAERERLFGIIEELVKWENSNSATVVGAARREIARSVARGLGEKPPEGEEAVNAFLAEKAPPVVDPFCGGGSIPLEAQRLGLRAHGSDLNPVAVLITKALIEIPPRFAGRPAIHPEARAEFGGVGGRGAAGLAEDVRRYGKWMRDEADRRIGHLYPKVRVTEAMATARPDLAPYAGKDLTVISWLWARTVASPNPAARGAHVPLVNSFILSSKKSNRVWVEPVIDPATNEYRFKIRVGAGTAPDGTVNRRGGRCLLTGVPMPFPHIRAEGKVGRMGARLMAVVAEGTRGRVYLDPTEEMEEAAEAAKPEWRPETDLPEQALGFRVQLYGLTGHADLFTDRQLVALGTFSDLVGEAREKVLEDALAAGMDATSPRLAEGGNGAQAYADAVATYLGFANDKASDYWSGICSWHSSGEFIRNTFARQAIPMVWDYVETNPFSGSTGNWNACVDWIQKVVAASPAVAWFTGAVVQRDAASAAPLPGEVVVSTDPPYYDNIGYADLSDFFYVWLRRCLSPIHPDLFGTLMTPKASELVATPYRFGGDREVARRFFETGLGRATANMRAAQAADFPMTLFYAYKQAETGADGNGSGATASTGWETMLGGIVSSGFAITGTWPVRSELSNRMLAKGTNALASSIVLACRARPEDAPMATRRDFATALKRELPGAIRQLQQENIAPVDLAQAAIGPGMAVFSRYAGVLEADGTPMPVRQALIEINRVLDETLAEAEGALDRETRFCIAWFEQYGFAERPYGEAEVLFVAKNTAGAGLEEAGVAAVGGGRFRLKRRDELLPDWDPATDRRLTDWECVQYPIRAMTAEAGGGVAEAARLVHAMGPGRAETARTLAYRLYTVCERKGWSDEALACNALATSWQQIREEAASLAAAGPAEPELALGQE